MSLFDFPNCDAAIAETLCQEQTSDDDSPGLLLAHYTIFRCASPPTITLADYVARLVRLTHPTIEAQLISVIYLMRLLRTAQDRRMYMKLNTRTVHRLFCTCLLLALKFWDERNLRAREFAVFAKITNVKELVMQELIALKIVDYRLTVTMEELVAARLFVTKKHRSFTSSLLYLSFHGDPLLVRLIYLAKEEDNERERAMGEIVEI